MSRLSFAHGYYTGGNKHLLNFALSDSLPYFMLAYRAMVNSLTTVQCVHIVIVDYALTGAHISYKYPLDHLASRGSNSRDMGHFCETST